MCLSRARSLRSRARSRSRSPLCARVQVIVGANATHRVSAAEDVWALGIVLFTMLTGDFPWLQAVPTDVEYARWSDAAPLTQHPWTMFSKRLVHLLRRMLATAPLRRCPAHYGCAFLTCEWFHSVPAGPACGAVEALAKSAASLDLNASASSIVACH